MIAVELVVAAAMLFGAVWFLTSLRSSCGFGGENRFAENSPRKTTEFCFHRLLPANGAKPSGTLVERILPAIGVPEHEKG